MLGDDRDILREDKLFYFIIGSKQLEIQNTYGKNTSADFNLGESCNTNASNFGSCG